MRDTATARERGLVGIAGVVFGETAPSVTGVEVIGTPSGDFALNVELGDGAGNCWLAADMIEFSITAGLVYDPDGLEG